MSVPVLDGLAGLAPAFDGLILDLWGVIHDGATVYPGAREALAELAARGKKTVLLSNAPRRAQALVELMTDLGIGRELYGAVMSSGEAVHMEMLARRDPWFAKLGRRCLHVGPARDLGLFDGLDLTLVARVQDAEFVMNTGLDGPDETVSDYAGLLDQALALKLPMVCANPDLVVVHEGRPFICAGALAAYSRSKGGDVAYRGKPDPAIYDVCMDLLGIGDRGRVLAVGDSFDTDVAGARAAGVRCLLIAGGIHAGEMGIRYGQRPTAEAVERAVNAHAGLRPAAAMGGFVW